MNSLKSIREDLGLKLKHVAGPTKISIGTISNYENGHSGISEEYLQRIADFLGVSVDEIKTPQKRRDIEKDKELVNDSMRIAFDLYKDLDKEDMLTIAENLYEISCDYQEAKQEKKTEKFTETVKKKILLGLAYKGFFEEIIIKEQENGNEN
jgi:transcriptional regulator with XRE-family HTH domain